MHTRSNLPSGWVLTTVAETGEVRVGPRRTPERQAGNAPTKYIRAANISLTGLVLDDVLEMDFSQEEVEVYSLQAGDVLVAEASGSPKHVGRAALWDGHISGHCYQNSVIRYRPIVTHPSYALAVFRHYATSGEFARVARGVNILHLGVGRFEQMPFPLPPYAEQMRIARELDSRNFELSQAETHLRSAAAKITSQVKEILTLSASGILLPADPTSSQAAAPQLPSVPVRESPTDRPYDLPGTWQWVRVDTVGEVTIGRQRHNRQTESSIIAPYLRVANVQEAHIDTTDVSEMPFTEGEYEHYSLKAGDILINEGQSPELVGRAAVFNGEVEGACFQNSLIRFRASRTVLPEYALLVFRHYLHSGEFRKIARWTTNIAHLSRTRFAAMPFPLPPLVEQERIVSEAYAKLSAAHEQQESVARSLENVSQMRGELYAAAVTGALCNQRKEDEPASTLLAHFTKDWPRPNDRLAASEKSVMSPPVGDSPNRNLAKDLSQPQAGVPRNSRQGLAQAIESAGRPVTLTELYRLCGYDQDSVADIENFYLLLKDELDRSVRRHSGNGEEVYLEVIQNAIA